MASHTDTETVIVGAGPAGLTAALVLARYRHPVLVVEGRHGARNDTSTGVHGHLGMDGVTPAEFQSRARQELSRYATVEFRRADADSVRATGDGFRIGLDDGDSLQAATVLLATGVVDVPPADVDGFTACWGHTVIHCPFCLGEENADRRWATVVDNADLAALSPVAFRAWTKDTIAICDASMPGLDEARSAARSRGGDLVVGTVRRLHHRLGSLYAVEFDDGRVLERETLVWTPQQRQQAVVARTAGELDLAVDDAGFVTVDATGCTSVPGLYAAGDLTSRWRQSVTASAAAGATAADALHASAILRAARL